MKTMLLLAFAFLVTSQHSEASSRKKLILSYDGRGNLEYQLNKRRIHYKRGHFFPSYLVSLDEAEWDALQGALPGIVAEEDGVVRLPAYSISKRFPQEGEALQKTNSQKQDWGFRAIRAGAAHKISKGKGVKVCVIDTGIDRTHPDLAANIAGGMNFTSDDPNAWGDENGHGTHVAGIIAALDNNLGTVGVAPKAKILAMKVLDASGSGTWSTVTDGIYACIEAGAQVINMSLGGQGNPETPSIFKTAVDEAASQGIYVVAGAGNSRIPISNYIPSGFSNVIAVSGMKKSREILGYTNFGLSKKDFIAPGHEIRSSYLNGGYATMSGTSMAAPHVAGVFALMISERRNRVDAIDIGLKEKFQGAGLVDALGTLQ